MTCLQWVALALFVMSASGCGGSDLRCGEGTERRGNECVAGADPISEESDAATGGEDTSPPRAGDPATVPSDASPAASAGSLEAARAACEDPSGTIVDPLGAEDVQQWLTRTWVYCSGDFVFEDSHAGLEFSSDGRWHYLDDVDGELVVREGFSGGGEWSLFEDYYEEGVPTTQLNLDRFEGGGIPAFPRFAYEPLLMNLNFGTSGLYAALPSNGGPSEPEPPEDTGAGDDDPPPTLPPSAGATSIAAAELACEEPGEIVDVSGETNRRAWLRRRWVYCDGPRLFEEEHSGLDFDEDGTWYFLDEVDGELVRRQGFAAGGEWKLQQDGVQLDITNYQSGTIPTFYTFAESPLLVNLSWRSAEGTVYAGLED